MNVKPRRRKKRKGGGFSWSTYWATRTPTLLIVTAMADTTTDFSWTAGADEPEGYKLKISTDGVTYTDKATVAGNVTTAQATGLTAGVLYYFKVVAYSGTNESDPTNIYDTRFKITIDTTKAGSANDTFVLPTTGAGYNAYVDWGDGSAEQNITGTPGNVTHDYNQTGEFQIKIRGTFPQIYFNNTGDKAKLITIDNWGNIKWSRMSVAFNGCTNLTGGSYIDCPNLSAVVFADSMFSGCSNFDGSVVGWSMPETTIVNGMFMNCAKFNKPLTGWNTDKVSDFANFLRGCTIFNSSVSDLNTSAATNITAMFYDAIAFNQPVPFITTSCTDMHAVFHGCKAFNQSLSTWDTSLNKDFNQFFVTCHVFNQSLANFDTSSGTNFSTMFQSARAFNQPINHFDMSSAENANEMFSNARAFNQSLSTWDVSKITNMNSMFAAAFAFNQDLSTWTPIALTTATSMFVACPFNKSLASWDISNVTTLENMFNAASGMSTANYDATLIAWAALTVNASVPFHAGDAKYSAGAATTARGVLTGAPNNWSITDGGQV